MTLIKVVVAIILLFAIGPWIADFALFSLSGVEAIPREWRSTVLQITYTSVAALFIGTALREWLDSWGKRDLQLRSAPDSQPHAKAAAPRQRHRHLGISLRELPAPSNKSSD
jgi:hypothetical protein